MNRGCILIVLLALSPLGSNKCVAIENGSSIHADPELSGIIWADPQRIREIAKIEIVQCNSRSFTSWKTLSTAATTKKITKPEAIDSFLGMLADGKRQGVEDGLRIKKLSIVKDFSFHILVFPIDKATYGYLLIRFHRSFSGALVALVQSDNGTDSVYLDDRLPEWLEKNVSNSRLSDLAGPKARASPTIDPEEIEGRGYLDSQTTE